MFDRKAAQFGMRFPSNHHGQYWMTDHHSVVQCLENKMSPLDE
jgi:hypothetical protein